MKGRLAKTSQKAARPRWASVVFIAVLIAVAATPAMAGFTGGPSVRVIPNTMVEIRWIAHFVGNGKVEIFELDFGSAAPLDTALTSGSGNDHTVSFAIGGVLKADTTYYFKVTHSDPTGVRADTVSDRLQFFTGVQVIGGGGGPVVEAGTDSAVITWGANVFGLGRVEYGTTTPGDAGTVDDEANAFGHSITLTGLLSNTTYQYRVSNRHAIDGGTLAEKTGSFSTPARCEDDQSQGAFNAGPSVRVSPNDSFEISWVEDFVGNGYVHIFDNPNSGTAINGGLTESSPHTDHRIDFTIGGVLKADTTYYFKVRQEDPTGVRAATVSPCLPVFTGAQTIGDVRVVADTDNAIISWEANVIGLGRVEYGTSAPGDVGTVSDQNNLAEHSIALTGLRSGTTYEYRVCNRHAIDGDCLATKTGSFTTPLVSSGTSVGCDSNALIAGIDSANNASGDILELSPGCTYTLNQPSIPGGLDEMPVGLPAITRAIIIHGNGATITRSGMNPPPFRIFQVDRTGTLAIDHLTVSGGQLTLGGGSNGGGILNCGTLIVTHSTISGNVADNGGGGIYNLSGELTVNQSTISSNQAFFGGGIANGGNVTVAQSTISDNDAQFGGGIYNSGNVTVTQSTISGNESTNSSNAETYGGAGIYNDPGGEVTVALSTISGNVSQSGGGGIYNRGSKVAFTQSTIFRNEAVSGGGIYNGVESGIVSISQSIIAENQPANCPSTHNITDGGYNLEDGNGCGFSQATSLSTTNPGLGPLQDNGGPTFTHALLPDSPAIDKGISNGLDTDQRGLGFPRAWDDPNVPNALGGDGADIGAFEFRPRDTVPPNITSSVVGTLGNNGWFVSDVTLMWMVTEPESSVTSQTGCGTQTVIADTGGVTFTCSATSEGGTSSQSVTVKRDTTAPVFNAIVTPNPVVLNGAATASPNGTDALSGIASQSCDPVNTTIAGNHSVACIATDNAGNTANAIANYEVLSGYNFVGFLQPVDNLPTLNLATAGSAVPIRFSLTGYWGLSIFAAGHPASSPIQCDASDPGAVIEETVNSGGSSLNYNVSGDQYSYTWKTDKAWKGTCRLLVLKLNDNSQHLAKFRFR